ncbi:MAG: phosphoribosylanthranilate isomerase [Acidihalobacter sp.]|uniref:phosphoribosylanthranilate isomerase n=1 Tax=Acidihalobacter sp. TaxID=1872108 RepID=UPI00307F2EB6
MRTRVKVCGITRETDAAAAVAAGADALGLVFYPKSPRCIEPAAAAALVSMLPPFVTTVGLFLDAEAEQVREIMRQVRLDVLQFHGLETAESCRSFGRPYMKAIGAGEGADLRILAKTYADACALLLDSHAHGQAGGTGRVFDWKRIPADLGRPVVLAGGLKPDNVAEAVRVVRPYAVDVSSGVEATPGIKDAGLIEAFMNEVRRGDSE